MKALILPTVALFLSTTSALAGVPCAEYGAHLDLEGKAGNKRDIVETAVFLPVACTAERLLFTDLRFKHDNQDAEEGNFGLGLRTLQETGILGTYAYFDRQRSGVTDKYHSQVTLGAEWLTQGWEVRANAYIPLSGEKSSPVITQVSDPYLSGSGLYVTEQRTAVREEGLYGADAEAGFKIPDSSMWFYGGAFSFDNADAPDVTGGRVRARYELTDWLALTAEGQYDGERGRQGWVGARLTVPLNGRAKRHEGLKSRMTAAPVRDVDIVTQARVAPAAAPAAVPVTNAATGQAQRVLYVDNTAAAGGDGTKETPYNSLAAAQGALQAYDTLYIASGSGTANMNAGLTIDKAGVTVIGAGTAFTYAGTTLIAAGAKPTITNTGGDGVTVTAGNVTLTGFTVSGASHDGIVVSADGNSVRNVTIANVAANNNRIGVYLHGFNGGSLTAAVESTITTGNSQHGMAVYDDTANTFEVDLGGGGRSIGNNALYGNTLEDLAVDYDGRTLSAQNNWWGQASGLYQSAPNAGLKPQIYYGAPINDGLVGHWTFDAEWIDIGLSTAYDRSGNGHNGTLVGSITAPDLVAAQNGEGLNISNDHIQITGLTELSNIYSAFAWISPNTTAGAGLENIVFANSPIVNTNYVAALSVDGGEITGYFHQNNQVTHATTGANITNGNWHNVGVASVRGGTTSLYVGGNANSSYTNPGTSTNWSGGVFTIGDLRPARGLYYDGIVDDVRLYNRILTTGEVAELYRMNTSSIIDVAGFKTVAP